MQSAKRNESNETAALYLANEAARESEFGNRAQARQTAASALALTRGRDVRIYAALALARAGDRWLSGTGLRPSMRNSICRKERLVRR